MCNMSLLSSPTKQLSYKASYCFINVKWSAIYFFGTSPQSVQEIDSCVDRYRRKTRVLQRNRPDNEMA